LKRDQIIQARIRERGRGRGLGVKTTQERAIARRRVAKRNPIAEP
jgi:hypothetical protein